MNYTPSHILKTYITLTLLSTFASSFIWGVNTLFLLDAGLSITGAFVANAFFTVGQVLFEIPTGVVADTWGRRASYLLGAATLLITTVWYFTLWQSHAALWQWALVSALLGLGFTFFSGATEAWLVDALHATHYTGTLEAAFAKGQIASGVAMLSGAVIGGVVAQYTNLGVPYILRAVALGLTFITAVVLMRDVGFTPRKAARPLHEMKLVFMSSLDHGFRKPAVRWMMLTGLFTVGIGFYVFYAMQPYLMELYGSSTAYAVSGLAAAIVAGSQIAGGFLAPRIRSLFRLRTTALTTGTIVSAVTLIAIGVIPHFWIVIGLLVIWGLLSAATMPIRQAYLNDSIPSAQRATVLSSDNLIGSAGGAVIQPGLGKIADVHSLGASYVVGACITLLSLPFLELARRTHPQADRIEREPSAPPTPTI